MSIHRPPRRSGTRRTTAATVCFFTVVDSSTQRRRACVTAECRLSGHRSIVVWGHGDASVRAALAQLTQSCDCPATYHRADRHEGHRLYS